MELVIKLDNKIYQDIIEGTRRERYSIVMYDFPVTIADAIADGMPLREGHGRLIDADVLKDNVASWLKPEKPCETEMVSLDNALVSTIMEIEGAETVIEADRENDKWN